MRRVIVVGPGAAGKSTLAVRLGEITGLPVIELDTLFWRPGLAATPRSQWAAIQHELASQPSWIMDGDLGPYDVIEVRLQAADTVVFLDFSPLRCLAGPVTPAFTACGPRERSGDSSPRPSPVCLIRRDNLDASPPRGLHARPPVVPMAPLLDDGVQAGSYGFGCTGVLPGVRGSA